MIKEEVIEEKKREKNQMVKGKIEEKLKGLGRNILKEVLPDVSELNLEIDMEQEPIKELESAHIFNEIIDIIFRFIQKGKWQNVENSNNAESFVEELSKELESKKADAKLETARKEKFLDRVCGITEENGITIYVKNIYNLAKGTLKRFQKVFYAFYRHTGKWNPTIRKIHRLTESHIENLYKNDTVQMTLENFTTDLFPILVWGNTLREIGISNMPSKYSIDVPQNYDAGVLTAKFFINQESQDDHKGININFLGFLIEEILIYIFVHELGHFINMNMFKKSPFPHIFSSFNSINEFFADLFAFSILGKSSIGTSHPFSLWSLMFLAYGDLFTITKSVENYLKQKGKQIPIGEFEKHYEDIATHTFRSIFRKNGDLSYIFAKKLIKDLNSLFKILLEIEEEYLNFREKVNHEIQYIANTLQQALEDRDWSKIEKLLGR